MQERRSLKVGIFMPNNSGSMSISTYKPDPDDWTFESNKKIAQAAEVAGMDFVFPVSRWKGFGGESDYMGNSLETMTWAAGLLMATEKIEVYSTVHVPVFNPVVAAKMGATLDHISNGRWGINIVSGWNKEEFEMMGIDMLPHENRYKRTEDFIKCLKGLWCEKPGTFDFESPYYKVQGGNCRPQPVRRPHPPIVNAGQSDDALSLVSRNCDWCFTAPINIDAAATITKDVKKRAKEAGRELRVVAGIMPIWDDDPDLPLRERDRLVKAADPVAIDNWASGVGLESGSFDEVTYEMFAFGAGSYPLLGTPDDIVAGLRDLYDVGVDGVLMSFLRYQRDTERFGQEIRPRLIKTGLI